MGGWKVWLSAAMSVGYGAAGFYFGLHDASTAFGFVNAGVAAVGIGHKIEKNTDAVKKETSVIAALKPGTTWAPERSAR